MEVRVAKLEADMDHVKRSLSSLDGDMRTIRTDVGAVKIDIATIKEKLNHLPTIGQMWAAAIGIALAIGGIVALAVRFIPPAP